MFARLLAITAIWRVIAVCRDKPMREALSMTDPKAFITGGALPRLHGAGCATG